MIRRLGLLAAEGVAAVVVGGVWLADRVVHIYIDATDPAGKWARITGGDDD